MAHLPGKSTEMFINMQDTPVWDPGKHYFDQKTSTIQFYEEEFEKIKNGVNIGGYHMHPWLYFHLNFFKTPIPTAVSGGGTVDLLKNPPLDDNSLYISANLEDAEKLNKVLFLFGCRGFSKSSFLASYTQQTILTKPDGNFSIIGGDEGDLKSISSLMVKSFNSINPAFFIPTIQKDWESYVSFGFKDKSTAGKTYVHSEIRITNAVKGSGGASEKGAGLSPIGYIMDEALHEDTLIYKEDGEIPIRDVQIGDRIYGQDGNLTTVLDKINPGIVDMYEFELSDNRTIKSSGNHLWTVYNTQKSKWEIKTTLELSKRYYQRKIDKRYEKENKSLIYSIPHNLPLAYPEKDLQVDPYWFGLWLGDGNQISPIIYTIDDEIEQYCKNYALQIDQPFVSKSVEIHCQNNKNFRVVSIIGKDKKNNYLLKKIQNLGLIRNKHIPAEYLRSSIDQRLSILQGLMDTDGSAVRKYSAEFSTSQPKLAKDFENLCRSLGIALKLKIKKGQYKKLDKIIETKNVYRFSLKTKLPIFRLSRKIKVFNGGIISDKKQQSFLDRITIKKITKLDSKSQAYCLKVDNKDRLFLAENYIVTHNCGKYAFKDIFESAIPSFKTQYGYKLVPILSGTSGNVELSKDAREVLENPDVFDILPMNFERLNNMVPPEFITWDKDFKKKFGTFVPGQMSYRLLTPRIDRSLSDFVGISSPELKSLKVKSTDWAKAKDEIDSLGGASAKEKTKDRNKMYYPLELDHCFLTKGANPFPTTIINKRIRELEESGKAGRAVEIIKDGAEYHQKFSEKRKADVRHKGGSIDAPIMLYSELPEKTPERYKFVSGLDDYKLNESDTDSLGAFYVIKRRNLEINSPCETVVASYVSRPDRHRDFHKTLETMIEVWAAECLMEAVDVSFEEYLELKGKAAKWLAPAITFAKSKDSRNNTKLQKKYGLFPTAGNNEHRMNVLVDWCWEEHTIGIDDEGVPITKYSVEFLDDIELLIELRDWQKGKNSDRKEAFSHALLHAHQLDADGIRPKSQQKNTGVLRFNLVEPENSGTQSRRAESQKSVNRPYSSRKMSAYSFRR